MANYLPNGNLVPGVHEMDLPTFEVEFGYNEHRLVLLSGLIKAIKCFESFGCHELYIDGSFVTQKEYPGDIDVCWNHIHFDYLGFFYAYPVFKDFSNGRAKQKALFGCEFFPMIAVAQPPSIIYYDFFQKDKNGDPKGVIKLIF